MLAVPVEADGDLVALVARVPEPGLHRSADADVEQEPQHRRAVRLGDVCRLVGRRVVDDDDRRGRVEGLDLVDDLPDRPFLVPRGDDRDEPSVAHAATPASSPTSSSSRRARCAYVCSSSTRSRARRPISSA